MDSSESIPHFTIPDEFTHPSFHSLGLFPFTSCSSRCLSEKDISFILQKTVNGRIINMSVHHEESGYVVVGTTPGKNNFVKCLASLIADGISK